MSIDAHSVLRIEPHRVVFRRPDGAACDVAMLSSRPARPTTVLSGGVAVSDDGAGVPRSAPPAAGRDAAGIPAAELDASIRATGPASWTLERAFVDRLRADQAALLSLARAIPYEEAGRVVGVRIYGVSRAGVLGRLGVRNGDLLRTLNGYQLGDVDDVLAAYTELGSASHLTLAIVRAGAPLTLDYRIE